MADSDWESECKWPNLPPRSFVFPRIFLIFHMFLSTAVSRCALSQTLVIALEFIIALILIIAPCAVRRVWKVSSTRWVQRESGTCSYPQPGFPYVNSLCSTELFLSPTTPCFVKEPDSDVQTEGITWQHRLKNNSHKTSGLQGTPSVTACIQVHHWKPAPVRFLHSVAAGELELGWVNSPAAFQAS